MEFSTNKEECITALFHLQSARRLLLAMGKYPSLDAINFEKTEFPWKDIFTSTLKLKVEVEGIKGQENRSAIAKDVSSELFSFLEKKHNLKPNIELRHPDILLIVFHNGDYHPADSKCRAV